MLRLLMTARRKDRRQKRDIGAEPPRARKVSRAVAGDGHKARRARPDIRRPPARRPMDAVGADGRGEALIARDEKQDAAPAADRKKTAGDRRASRMVVIAKDDSRSRRQGAQNRLRIGDAAPVGHEGERKWRESARRLFERLRGGC